MKKLYKKISDGHFKEVSVDEVNSQLESVGGAKVWDGGNTYYYQELKHLGKTGVDPRISLSVMAWYVTTFTR